MTLAPEAGTGSARRTPSPGGWLGWITTTDHKRIGLLTSATSLVMMFVMGFLALLMRAQLAQPNEHLLGPQLYNQLFTIHGSGMIYMVMTPFALGLGVYLVPLQVGAPSIAIPRTTLLGYWLYAIGTVIMLVGFATPNGAHANGWFSYPPMADSQHTIAMGMSGFTVAALAPGVILATRDRPLWRHLSVPGPVALPLFLLLHAGGTLTPVLTGPPLVARWLSEAALLGGGFLFWLPVIGTRHRLSEPGRCLYLFLAAPALDLPALGMMAMGHTFGGLAMILGMQPISVAALAVTWRWITTEGVLTGEDRTA